MPELQVYPVHKLHEALTLHPPSDITQRDEAPTQAARTPLQLVAEWGWRSIVGEGRVPVYNGSSAPTHLMLLPPQVLVNISDENLYALPHPVRLNRSRSSSLPYGESRARLGDPVPAPRGDGLNDRARSQLMAESISARRSPFQFTFS